MTPPQARRYRRTLSIHPNLLSPHPSPRSLRRRLLSQSASFSLTQESSSSATTFFQFASNPSPSHPTFELPIPPPTQPTLPAFPAPPPPPSLSPPPPPPSPLIQPIPSISTPATIPGTEGDVQHAAQLAPLSAQVPPPVPSTHQVIQPALKPLPHPPPAANHSLPPSPPQAIPVPHIPLIATIPKPVHDNHNHSNHHPSHAIPPAAAHIPNHQDIPPPTPAAKALPTRKPVIPHIQPAKAQAPVQKPEKTAYPVKQPEKAKPPFEQPERIEPVVKVPVAYTPSPQPHSENSGYPAPLASPHHPPKLSSSTPSHPAVNPNRPAPASPHQPAQSPTHPESSGRPQPSPLQHAPANLGPMRSGFQTPPAPQAQGTQNLKSTSPAPVQVSQVVVPQTHLFPVSYGNNHTLASNNLTSTVAPSNNVTFLPVHPVQSNLSGIDSGSAFSNVPSDSGTVVPNVSTIAPTDARSNRLGKAMGGMFGSLVGLSAVLVAAVLVARRRRGHKPKTGLGSDRGSLPAMIARKRDTVDSIFNSPTLMVECENGSTIRSGLAPADPVTRYSQGGVTLLNRLQGITANLAQGTAAHRAVALPSPSPTFDPAIIESHPSDFSLPGSNGTNSAKPDERHDTGMSLVDPALGAASHRADNPPSPVSPGPDSFPVRSNEGEETRRFLQRSDSDADSIRNPFEHELSSSSDVNDARISLGTDFNHANMSPGGIVSPVSANGDSQLLPIDFGHSIVDHQERLVTPSSEGTNHSHELLTQSIMQSLSSSSSSIRSHASKS